MRGPQHSPVVKAQALHRAGASRDLGLGFRVLGFRVYGLGFRDLGLALGGGGERG